MIFNGKIFYKIVQTDSNDSAKVYVHDTQIENSDDGKSDTDTFILKESTNSIAEKLDADNISLLIE